MKTKFINLTKLTIFAAAACLLLTAPSASASLSFGKETLTFENVPTFDWVPGGYGSLNWEDFLNVYAPLDSPSGIPFGTVSGHNDVYGYSPAFMYSDGYQFYFNSAYFTAAFRDNLQLQIWGYNGEKLVYVKTVYLSATHPTKVLLPNSLVTEVVFVTSGGTAHPGYYSTVTGFVMDNAMINVLPIPGQAVLF